MARNCGLIDTLLAVVSGRVLFLHWHAFWEGSLSRNVVEVARLNLPS